ncbi:hypothetical protein ACYZTL_07195 [Pseudomonas sp. LB3P81]
MQNKSVKILSDLIFESYINEVCLDRAMKDKFLADKPRIENFPAYKALSIYPLFKKYGLLILAILWVVRLLMVPAVFLFSIISLLMSFVVLVWPHKRKLADLPENICLPNTQNLKLFKYLYGDLKGRVFFVCKRPFDFVGYLSPADFVKGFLIVVRVLAKTLAFKGSERVLRRDLILHMFDLVSMAWFSLFIHKLASKGKAFVTDSNHQRWDYVITHLSKRCDLIQHAYIHADLKFDYSFGQIKCLYVFDSMFEQVFLNYYTVSAVDVIIPNLKLDLVTSEKPVLFLASSAPFVNIEIDFLKQIRQKSDFCIVVKLHPSHVYDSSVKQLTVLADRVVGRAVFPDCDVMASYDSFLGYEYKALGKRVVFLKDEISEDLFAG